MNYKGEWLEKFLEKRLGKLGTNTYRNIRSFTPFKGHRAERKCSSRSLSVISWNSMFDCKLLRMIETARGCFQ